MNYHESSIIDTFQRNSNRSHDTRSHGNSSSSQFNERVKRINNDMTNRPWRSGSDGAHQGPTEDRRGTIFGALTR